MRKFISITATAIALAAIPLGAQSAVRLQLAPGSELTFTGTSTLHPFTCTTHTMQAYIDVDDAYRTKDLNALAHPIAGVQVVIPVKSLACGGELEKNMLKTIRADQYPYVTYKLTTYDLVGSQGSATAIAADTKGKLAISGTENPITMRIDATKNADGLVTATGGQTLKLTDFGIKPPSFMLGTLRVGNEVKVRFTLKATSAAVSSAIRELGLPATTTVALLQQ